VVTNTPMWRYLPNALGWESTGRDLASPAPDGSVAYYEDTLAPVPPVGTEGAPLFNDAVARAVCQHLKARIIERSVLEIVDGPFLQLVDDDGCTPFGWVVLRAIAWVDEYDFIVDVSDDAVGGVA